jgi:hypothetical protein
MSLQGHNVKEHVTNESRIVNEKLVPGGIALLERPNLLI